jgi:hypothetical protein
VAGSKGSLKDVEVESRVVSDDRQFISKEGEEFRDAFGERWLSGHLVGGDFVDSNVVEPELFVPRGRSTEPGALIDDQTVTDGSPSCCAYGSIVRVSDLEIYRDEIHRTLGNLSLFWALICVCGLPYSAMALM